MGVGPAEARDLSYWEYSALLQSWNARHDPDGERAPVAPPPGDFVRGRQARLAARGFCDDGGVEAPRGRLGSP